MANRTAILISFTLLAVNSIAAPKFAALYKQGDTKALQKTVQQSAKLMTLSTGPILLLFLSIPNLIMEFFGPEFIEGTTALRILAIGQFVNVATGSVGYLLMMTGNERLLRNSLLAATLLYVTLNIILMPSFGLLGAAIATAISLVFQNLISAIFVWRRLGIVTFSFR